ncbi:MAG: hypothetical protein H0W55_13175 [Actinobacteria bacterium]|nr:hypothetical protein [Actinomycetota bacterium]
MKLTSMLLPLVQNILHMARTPSASSSVNRGSPNVSSSAQNFAMVS